MWKILPNAKMMIDSLPSELISRILPLFRWNFARIFELSEIFWRFWNFVYNFKSWWVSARLFRWERDLQTFWPISVEIVMCKTLWLVEPNFRLRNVYRLSKSNVYYRWTKDFKISTSTNWKWMKTLGNTNRKNLKRKKEKRKNLNESFCES